jgi:hypothetical protein
MLLKKIGVTTVCDRRIANCWALAIASCALTVNLSNFIAFPFSVGGPRSAHFVRVPMLCIGIGAACDSLQSDKLRRMGSLFLRTQADSATTPLLANPVPGQSIIVTIAIASTCDLFQNQNRGHFCHLCRFGSFFRRGDHIRKYLTERPANITRQDQVWLGPFCSTRLVSRHNYAVHRSHWPEQLARNHLAVHRPSRFLP